MNNEIAVTAVTVGYTPDAMQDDFDNGGASYDASDLQVEAPETYKGRRLRVYHDEPVDEASPFRTTGRRLRFHMREKDLTGSATLFAGALRDVTDAR